MNQKAALLCSTAFRFMVTNVDIEFSWSYNSNIIKFKY